MMKRPSPLDDLWGSTLETCSFDLASQRLSLGIRIIDSSAPAGLRQVDFLRVTELHFSNSIPSPWEYAEVTEIRARMVGKQISAVLTLWSEDAQLRVVCEQLLLDGEGLTVGAG